MKKSGLILGGLLSLALVLGIFVFACGGNGPEPWVPVETGQSLELDSLTVASRPVVLGGPSTAPSLATPGYVLIYSSEKSDGNPTLIRKSPKINVLAKSGTARVAWAVSAAQNAAPAEADYDNATLEQLKNGDYLWIKITDGRDDVGYYLFEVQVAYGPEEFAIKNHPASRSLANSSAWTAPVNVLTVAMEYPLDDAYIYQWYSNTTFSNEDGTAVSTATSDTYTPSITADGDYYYYATVTFGDDQLVSNVAYIKVGSAAAQAPTEFKIGTDRLNYVRGVGGTGAFMFRTGGNADASPDADVKYIDILFGEIGSNILRIMVQDDYLNYINNLVQSRNSNVFPHDARKNFFPVIRRANEYGGYVFANPWTAPARMKQNRELIGGPIIETPSNYVDYANHLRDFLLWLNDNDAPIFSLGILNEPDFGGGSNYEGMGMNANVSRDWFRTVGNFTTQRVTNRSGAGPTSSQFADSIIPGYGGGGPTHHVLAMSGDTMGDVAGYMNPQISSTGENGANNRIELIGRHYYANASRYVRLVGAPGTPWKDRPQEDYTGPHEAASLAMSPQMYAPGSVAGNIKREVWQTEHDFNYYSVSTVPPSSNVQNYWNSAFAAVNDVDWALRVVGESVFDWWFSSSYSGLVTGPSEAFFPPYTITPRGRAFAHYARYVAETWLLPIERTRGTIDFNNGASGLDSAFDAGSTVPKISAFEDVNGKFITVVMFTPSLSTFSSSGGVIGRGFGAGGTYGADDPTRGSTNVGRLAVVLPDGFTASSASAIRSYGHDTSTGEDYDAGVPEGSPRYWIDEPVFLSADGKSVEVTLPGGNLISIMIRGEWSAAASAERHFEERVRPYRVK